MSDAAAKREMELQKVKQEWGFQNEETMKIWEARQKHKAGKKKPKKLTADEKLKKFRAMNNR